MDTHTTTDHLTEEIEQDRRSRILCIGPAGENLVRIAAVMNDKNRAYGRSGPGAVFGSKKLKAIRVSGSKKIKIKDREQYQSGLDQAIYLLKAIPATKRLFRELGTAEQWIKEGKHALNWTRLSCKQFISNQVRLDLFVLAYNLGNFLRQLSLPGKIKQWSLRSLLVKLIKIGAKVLRHIRYVAFQMAEVAISKEIFAEILFRINRLRHCS